MCPGHSNHQSLISVLCSVVFIVLCVHVRAFQIHNEGNLALKKISLHVGFFNPELRLRLLEGLTHNKG